MNDKLTEFSTIRCNHYPLCSGCSLQEHVNEPPKQKLLAEFFKTIAPDLFIPLHCKEIVGWRTRAKLAVRGDGKCPQIGLFHFGTHDVVDIPDCPLHHPAINAAIAILKTIISKVGIEPYNEEKNLGLLRYVQLAVERKSNLVQLVLVLNRENSNDKIDHFVKQLYIANFWHSIWLNFQPKAGNTIFGEKWMLCEGEEFLCENLMGIDFFFHPACFCQAHLSLFDEMLQHINHLALKGKKVVEFYGGVGIIGLSLLEKSSSLVCIEVNPFAKECFYNSVRKMDKSLQKKAFFREGLSENCLEFCDSAEVAIVDPPRKGLSKILREKLKRSPSLQQIIYISCGFAGFQRDSVDLIDAGWRVKEAAGYLLFPGSDHIEILCIFEPKNGS